jgi:UDP-N-acetylmuramoyl-L-alanyl-D-glutamate--2,6-diaminopimelate ligase
MWITELLAGMAVVERDIEFENIALDSREITNRGVFFAIAGAKQHGLQFAEQVVRQGAVAIIYDPAGQGVMLAKEVTGVALFAVEELADKLGELAARFYARPAEHLNIIGITGTNGKTSCSQFLAQVLPDAAVIGTLGWGAITDLHSTVNTTPDALAIQRILAQLLAQSVDNVAIEVSSHGLAQGRVNGVNFKGAVFNNLSRDHLDYHGSMDAYFQAKLPLVQWPNLQFVVLNLDDAYAERVLEAIAVDVDVVTYSMRGHIANKDSSILVSDVSYTLQGIECQVFWQTKQAQLKLALLGDFNLQNILAVLGVLLAMGKTLTQCVRLLQSVKPVMGRMECFNNEGMPLVVVDYAHTPDALQKVLLTLRKHCQATLTVVFGCGGNRDTGKRRLMGDVAVQLADKVVITDDNPRFEDGQSIINEIIADVESENLLVIRDRKQAIVQSISTSSVDDIVLIAGKGHENYQDIQGVQYPFSDRDIVQAVLAA